MKQIVIDTENRKVIVKKLPLGKYVELLKAIKELPKHVEGLQGADNSTILQKLPEIIAVSLPAFVGIITIATDLTPEEVNDMGLDEVVDVVLAIIEVNKYKEVFDKIKKAVARQENKEVEKLKTG